VRPDPPDLPPEPDDPDLSAPYIEEARLTGASLAGQRRPNLSVRDCELRDCDLANLDARGGALLRVRVVGGRLTGCNLGEAGLGDVELEGCAADLTAFTGSRLERVRFAACNLARSDFQGARLRTVVFEDCDLRGADFTGARFDGVDLVGCRLDGIRGAHELRGVRMPWPDVLEHADLFAAACGVQILEA
jgi:uncharacterized protein YjbI with pentapeptide repeats